MFSKIIYMILVDWNFNQVMEITFIKHLFMNLCLFFCISNQNNLLDQKKNKTFVSKQSQKLCYLLKRLCGIPPHLLLLIKTFITTNIFFQTSEGVTRALGLFFSRGDGGAWKCFCIVFPQISLKSSNTFRPTMGGLCEGGFTPCNIN
jgi:hypothetical protein